MRLKYLIFLLTFNFVFAKQQILNLCCLRLGILYSCCKLKLVLIRPARIYKKRMAQAIRF